MRLSFLDKSEVEVECDGKVFDEVVEDEWTNLKLHIADIHNPNLSRMKGKDRPDTESSMGSRYTHNTDSHSSKCSDSSPSAAMHDSSSPSTSLHSHFQHHSSASLPSRHRTSFLSAASDAFGLRKKIVSVSRKKPNLHPLPHSSHIMPGVIEINAYNDTTVTSTVGGTTAHRDCEHEERERLRDMAAQSIGLDPELLHHPSGSESRPSLDSPQSPPQPLRIPPFPATLASLRPLTELSATLPKFVPPSSLLVYALARQWKPRTIVLTTHSLTRKTHVHLFKSASKDEKELERVEVTEDSVIFVAEEEVGGRGHVIKLAGKDVSTKRTGPVDEDSLRTMWFLQITDPAESQRWIGAIKNAVLTQRAARAGLDIPSRVGGGNEPKGDMDVMLSMRLQGIIPNHPAKSSTVISPPSPPMPTSPSPPPSLRSLRLSIPSSSPTAAMKGIFSGTRPRSPSVEGSPVLAYPPGHAEESFAAAGTNLLTMLRTKASADSGSSPSQSLSPPLPHVQGRGSPAPSLRSNVVITASDLKISKERDAPEPSIATPEADSSDTPPAIAAPIAPVPRQGVLTLSLQPPPRKPKHTVAIAPATLICGPQGMYKQAGGNRSVAGDFGISSTPRDSGDLTPRGTSPMSVDSGGQPVSFSPSSDSEAPSPCVDEVHGNEQKDEAISTLLGNGIHRPPSCSGSMSTDKLAQNTVVTKRWSRQGVPLPKQLTPPSGPPPSIPSFPEKNHRSSVESSISISVTYTANRSSSGSSSNSHTQALVNSRSGSSLSPTFWKRASGSSTYSASSTSTSDSPSRQQRPVPFRGDSFPSSLESVIGNAGSSRPMSMSVVGSSPMTHIGTTKRRSMPPPRPAPKFAPPPAPTVPESGSTPAPSTMPAPTPRKSFRSSITQRALRLSLTSPKPPPSSALPPRPDEAPFDQSHRRGSGSGSQDLQSVRVPSPPPASILSRNSNPIQSAPPPRSLSLKHRLRILSAPSTSCPLVEPSSLPSIQVSTLDLSDDNDDDPPTPYFQSPHPFGLGEHIITLQNDPSFLQLETPAIPTIPKPPPCSPYKAMPTMSGLGISPFEPDFDFVALSPPPPRRGSKPHITPATRLEKEDNVEKSGSAEPEEGKLVAPSQGGSVVSLGFVTT